MDVEEHRDKDKITLQATGKQNSTNTQEILDLSGSFILSKKKDKHEALVFSNNNYAEANDVETKNNFTFHARYSFLSRIEKDYQSAYETYFQHQNNKFNLITK